MSRWRGTKVASVSWPPAGAQTAKTTQMQTALLDLMRAVSAPLTRILGPGRGDQCSRWHGSPPSAQHSACQSLQPWWLLRKGCQMTSTARYNLLTRSANVCNSACVCSHSGHISRNSRPAAPRQHDARLTMQQLRQAAAHKNINAGAPGTSRAPSLVAQAMHSRLQTPPGPSRSAGPNCRGAAAAGTPPRPSRAPPALPT